MLCVPHEYWNNRYALVLAAAGLTLCIFRRREMPRFRWTGLTVGIAAYLALTAASVLWAEVPGSALRSAAITLTGAALGLIVYLLYPDAESARTLWRAIRCALILTAAYGLVRYALGCDTYCVLIRGELRPRLAATLEHGINYAEFAAMAFPPALALTLDRGAKRERSFWLVLLTLPLAAVGATYSRTGYLALGTALLIQLRPWRFPVASLILAAVGACFLPPGVRSRLLSVFILTDESASGRFTLWQECLAVCRKNLWIGVGPGSENFLRAYLPCAGGTLPFTPPSSNLGYLEPLLCLGIIGEVSYLLFFFGIFPRLRRAIRRRPEGFERRMLRSLEASLAGAALANVPEHLWFYPRVFFFWCVLYALACRLSAE